MAKVKTNAEMLTSIKQYNKDAREVKAKKEGFSTAAQFILYLESEISNGRGNELFGTPGAVNSNTVKKAPKEEKKGATSTARPVIHIADVLDSSGSMSGEKIKAAILGVNAGIESLKVESAAVVYTYTLCDFSDDIIFRHIKAPLSSVDVFKGGTRGSTSLYDAIGDTIERIKTNLNTDDKVLVNIYTDGEENSSRRYNATIINQLIKTLSEQGWTFTFIGTARDVSYVQKHLSVHDSNTLVHDNTGAGMSAAFATNSVSRSAYSSKVSAGEDASIGFYKDIN